MAKTLQIHDEISLLNRFNHRDPSAFAEVYNLYYLELIYYAKKMYAETTISAYDVVQDLFIKIWEKKSIQFAGVVNIKSYLYASIRNGFIDYIIHNKCVTNFTQSLLKNTNYNITEMVESETLSVISEAMGLLSEECAKVFRLHLEGWSVKEIAEILQKSPSTIYAQKQSAISTLSKKLTKSKMLIILLLLKL